MIFLRSALPGLRKFGVLVAFLLMGLSGCQSIEILTPKEPVTIRFAPGFESDNDDYYQDLVEAFSEENPYITVELVSFRQVMREDGSLELDAFIAPQGALPYLSQNNTMISLNTLMAEDKDFDLNDFYPSTIDALSTEGQRWGVPYSVDMWLMYYNKDSFDRYGVPYPQVGWTWDAFVDQAISLSNPDAGEFGYAYRYEGGQGFVEALALAYAHGGQLFDDLQQPTRPTFTLPENVAALQLSSDLIHKYHASPRTGERSLPYPGAGIETGKYAMWMGWYSEDWDVNAGRVMLPQGETPGTLGGVEGLFILTNSQDVDACWKWITFVSEQMPPALVPARRSMVESDAYRQRVGEDTITTLRAGLENLVAVNFNVSPDLEKKWGIVTNALTTALSRIHQGEDVQMTLDEAQKDSGF